MATSLTCVQCSKIFTVYQRRDLTRKFCGSACYRAHEKIHGRAHEAPEPIRFVCKECGKPFQKNPGELRAYQKAWGKDPMYCSRECGGQGRRLKDEDWDVKCVQCGKPVPIFKRAGGYIDKRKMFCGPECRSLHKRIRMQIANADRIPIPHPARHGYLRLTITGVNGEPSREVLEHRYRMEQKLGRLLRPEETVHHINGIRSDNSDENLELFASRHGPGQRVYDQAFWAINFLFDYPEFAAALGYEIRAITPKPIPLLLETPKSQLDFPPNVS